MLDGIIHSTLLMLVGVYLTLIGYRWVNPSKPTADPVKAEEWHRRYGGFMRVSGPILIVGGLVRLLFAWGVFSL